MRILVGCHSWRIYQLRLLQLVNESYQNLKHKIGKRMRIVFTCITQYSLSTVLSLRLPVSVVAYDQRIGLFAAAFSQGIREIQDR